MKHLLFISEGFAPWGGPAAMRATKLTRCGLERGLRVSVLTTAMACRHVFDDPDLLTEVEGAEIVRVSDGTDYPLRTSIADRVGYYSVRIVDRLVGKSRAKWGADAVGAARGRWDGDRPDLIFATAPTHQVVLIAEQLSRAWDVPYVMDYRDPPGEIGMPQADVARTLSTCMLASLNTPPATEHLQQLYPQFAEKIECWTNGTEPVRETFEPIESVKSSSRLNMLFAGGVYPWVVEAIAKLEPFLEQGRVGIDVFGFREPKRRKQLEQLRSLGAELHSPIPSNELLKRIRRYDANLVTSPPRHQISSKIYHAIASGRAVVMFRKTDSSRVLMDGLPGIFAYDSHSTLSAMSQMFDSIKNYDPAAGWPARYRWLQSKTWPKIFAGIFDRFL